MYKNAFSKLLNFYILYFIRVTFFSSFSTIIEIEERRKTFYQTFRTKIEH